jgi:hypothetical protein
MAGMIGLDHCNGWRSNNSLFLSPAPASVPLVLYVYQPNLVFV